MQALQGYRAGQIQTLTTTLKATTVMTVLVGIYDITLYFLPLPHLPRSSFLLGLALAIWSHRNRLKGELQNLEQKETPERV